MADSLSEMQELRKSLELQENREALDNYTIESCLNQLYENEPLDRELTLERLRVLRNCVANTKQNADLILTNLLTENHLDHVIQKYINNEDCLFLRIFAQLLANILCQKVNISHDQIDILRDTLKSASYTISDDRTANFVSFSLFSLMEKCKEEDLEKFSAFISFWNKNCHNSECEFHLLCLKHFVVKHSLPKLDVVDRHVLYPVIKDLELCDQFDEGNIDVIISDFTRLTDFVFKTQHTNMDDMKPVETITLLDIIIVLSKSEGKRSILQKNKSLMINTLYLLRMIHELGKLGKEESVKPISKLSELANLKDNQQLEDDPIFGLKVKLIQLIVNLVWEHPENQNLVGEHSGFQLLLDCSQVDARNPFITQWVVMSVKALCQGNPENQAILAGLRREGVADSALWKELGIQLDPNDDKIKVASSK
eukprot:TRINITY_DN3278_c0_g1_i7.p1 TRINITY_DN3278_c0_g1~~TRINITY_DN3278_c0_g1_i7.p1  ORF type:complete len:425 (-),score=74.36 TRINITY_DN3278_c0_g1_i7:319-1593(-)